jgi:DNA polymerase III epsilon subunit-like protein
MQLIVFDTETAYSGAVEKTLHAHLGFGGYNAHDAFFDCLATWRVLLYALLIVYGLETITDEESVTNVVLSLMESFT